MKTLLHFTAEWCGPCQDSIPAITEFFEKHPDVAYIKIDIDKDQILRDSYAQYDIGQIPNFVGMINGDGVRGHLGTASVAWLESCFDGQL